MNNRRSRCRNGYTGSPSLPPKAAKALVSNEAAIQKRLYRAKEYIKKRSIRCEIPAGEALRGRLETVYTVLYLLFNEGYHSVKADIAYPEHQDRGKWNQGLIQMGYYYLNQASSGDQKLMT